MWEHVRCAYLGNFSSPASTESHVAASFEALGHEVLRIQEGETKTTDIINIAMKFEPDMFLWTQTLGLAETGGTKDERLKMLSDFRGFGVPTVGFHLDRWFGLDRETQVATEPFFSVDHLFTADGGHDDQWEELGVNHHWLPPGVYHAEAYDGTPRREYQCDVVFVGSWRHYAHEEHWPIRKKMLDTLRTRYGPRFKTFPVRQAVRGTDLTDLYASCKVAVGDSCLVGSIGSYVSDRVPESIGRGAALVHPHVEGLSPYFIPDEHFASFPLGDHLQMIRVIDDLVSDAAKREHLRVAGATHVRSSQTYRDRMNELLAVVLGD